MAQRKSSLTPKITSNIEKKDFLAYTLGKEAKGSLASKIDGIVKNIRHTKTFREQYMTMFDELKHIEYITNKRQYEKGIAEGSQERAKQAALRMLEDGEIPDEKIANFTQLSLQQVQELKRKTLPAGN